MRGWRRTTGGAGAAAGLAVAAIFGYIPGASAQLVTPECTFTNDDIDEAVAEDGSGLFNVIAAALDVDPEDIDIVIPILIVPTFNEKLGQDVDGTFSDLVICRNETVIGAFDTTTTESDRFPPDPDTADLLEIEQTSYILIELVDGVRRLRICQTGRTTNECIVATQPAPPSEE